MITNQLLSPAQSTSALQAAEYDLNDSLVGILEHVNRVGRPARLSLRSGRGHGMTVDPIRRLCDVGGVDIDVFCLARASDIQVTFQRDGVPPMVRPRPMSEVLWRAGFLGSAGRPVVGCSRFDVVRFTAWPTLSRLPHDEDCVRVLALLTRHPTSIALARSITGVSELKLNRLYAAGLAAQLVEVVNRRVRAPAPLAGFDNTPREHMEADAEHEVADAGADIAPPPVRRWVSSLFSRLRAL